MFIVERIGLMGHPVLCPLSYNFHGAKPEANNQSQKLSGNLSFIALKSLFNLSSRRTMCLCQSPFNDLNLVLSLRIS